MKSLEDLRAIKDHIKTLVAEQEKIKNGLVEQVFTLFPNEVARSILEKVELGLSPMPVVNEHIRFEKEKGDGVYGKVVWVD